VIEDAPQDVAQELLDFFFAEERHLKQVEDGRSC